ncbi:hypothetical protein DFH29DRAFT_875575 [Suillus ampliporus]|nr:hypothetical protein DFH29DRAFT_875575 [Suillus ampliporus]
MEEQEAACKEEQKKNKAKFIPVGNTKVPSIPVIIPSHYATRKLKAGDYCELYYFTNKGLKDTKKSLLSTESPGLMLLTTADGQQTWVNADKTCDLKAIITKDKNLSWEHFSEAALRMTSTKATKKFMSKYGNLPILSRCQPATHIVCASIQGKII